MKCSKNKKAIIVSSKSCGGLFDVVDTFGISVEGLGGSDIVSETIGTRNGRSKVSPSPGVFWDEVVSGTGSEVLDFSSSGNKCNNVRIRWSRRFDNRLDCTRSGDIWRP